MALITFAVTSSWDVLGGNERKQAENEECGEVPASFRFSVSMIPPHPTRLVIVRESPAGLVAVATPTYKLSAVV